MFLYAPAVVYNHKNWNAIDDHGNYSLEKIIWYDVELVFKTWNWQPRQFVKKAANCGRNLARAKLGKCSETTNVNYEGSNKKLRQ